MTGPRLAAILVLATWCAAAFPGGLAGAAETTNETLYFVQITDTHLGEADADARARLVVDAVNKLPFPVQFVVHTGDITSEKLDNPAVVSNAVALFGQIKVPVHYLPGNHDILRRQHDATSQVYTNVFGRLADERDYAGVRFVFLDTEPLAKAYAAPGFDPLAELEAALKRAGDRPVIVCQHTPSVEDFYGNRVHPGWKEEARAPWDKLLNSANVKAVIAGHFHRDELHWIGRVPLYVASSVAGFWGRQASFRVYEYRDGKLGYRTVYLP